MIKMKDPTKQTTRFTIEQTEEAGKMLWKGGIVALPTETVYGLCASAEEGVAISLIYNLKERDYDKPIAVLVDGMKMVEKYCKDIPEGAYRLAEKYWPGPLTMILPDAGRLPAMVTAFGKTLGVRCPDHPLTLAVIKALDAPVAATSANPSGKESATTAQQVMDYFDTEIEGILDGGPCAVGVESTIVDLSGEEPEILREGGIPGEEILAFLAQG